MICKVKKTNRYDEIWDRWAGNLSHNLEKNRRSTNQEALANPITAGCAALNEAAEMQGKDLCCGLFKAADWLIIILVRSLHNLCIFQCLHVFKN